MPFSQNRSLFVNLAKSVIYAEILENLIPFIDFLLLCGEELVVLAVLLQGEGIERGLAILLVFIVVESKEPHKIVKA